MLSLWKYLNKPAYFKLDAYFNSTTKFYRWDFFSEGEELILKPFSRVPPVQKQQFKERKI